MITPIKNVFLNINNICQYRCEYCWVRKTKGEQLLEAKKKMTPEILEKGYEFFKQYQKRTLKMYPHNVLYFIFATKEPLLNFNDLIKPFIEKVNFENEEYKIRFSILTNGEKMTPEIAAFYEKYNIFSLMSLDGNEISNNTNRIFYEGGENVAFQKTMRGASMLPVGNRHFTFTLNKNTIPYLRDSLEFLLSYPHGWTRFNYNLYSQFTSQDWEEIANIFENFIESHDKEELKFLYNYITFSPSIDEGRGIIMGIDYKGDITIKKPFHSSIPWYPINIENYSKNNIQRFCGTVFNPIEPHLRDYIAIHGVNYSHTSFYNFEDKDQCSDCICKEACHPINFYSSDENWKYYLSTDECMIKRTNFRICQAMRRKFYGF